MSVLQPLIDSGVLVVKSGQTTIEQVATLRWDGAVAQKRMEDILVGNYADGSVVTGVLSPYDGLSRGIIAALTDAGYTKKNLPIITGQDAEVLSVKSMIAGEQYSTIYKDTRKLVAETVALVTAVCGGEVFPTTAEFTTDGGVVIASDYLEPIIVTSENGTEVYADNEELLAAFQAGQ